MATVQDSCHLDKAASTRLERRFSGGGGGSALRGSGIGQAGTEARGIRRRTYQQPVTDALLRSRNWPGQKGFQNLAAHQELRDVRSFWVTLGFFSAQSPGASSGALSKLACQNYGSPGIILSSSV